MVQHFNNSFGITFHHLEPLNEPGQTSWTAGNPQQEGCGFNLSHQEETIQDELNSLASKGLVTQLAAMDETEEGILNNAAKMTAYELATAQRSRNGSD